MTKKVTKTVRRVGKRPVNTKFVGLNLNKDLRDFLYKTADEECRSVSNIMRIIIEDYSKRKEKELEENEKNK